jgi:hypothetical protein
MSSFKKLSNSDVTHGPYIANKQWTLPYNTTSSNGYVGNDSYFNVYKGTNITGTFVSNNASIDPITNGQYERLVYNSINHIFYQDYSGSLLNTSSIMFNVDTYTSASQQRPTSSYFIIDNNPNLIDNFPTGANASIIVLSVNQSVYGSQILPYSFNLSSSAYFINDDGNGNIYDIGPAIGGYISQSYFVAEDYFTNPVNDILVGNIYYSQGIVIITNPSYQTIFPLPPLAYNTSSIFTASLSPKKINLTSSNLVRTGTLNTGSIILSGSNSSYYTVNGDGTITLTTTTAGNYNIYYTIGSTYGSGYLLTSNPALITVTVN